MKRLTAKSLHGIYTTGSTGEFYALEFDEFCLRVDIQAELCGEAVAWDNERTIALANEIGEYLGEAP